MKLVEILAKELKEWPVETDEVISQSCFSTELLYGGTYGYEKAFVPPLKMTQHNDDEENYPVVTKEMWEAEKAKLNVQSTPVKAESFDPIYCRDRIKEIDSLVESLEEERVSLVQALEDEGFVLVSTAPVSAAPVEDMSDWNNWKVGDCIEVIAEGMDECCKGDMLIVSRFDLADDDQPLKLCEVEDEDDVATHWPVVSDGHFYTLKWHSRPQQ